MTDPEVATPTATSPDKPKRTRKAKARTALGAKGGGE